MENLCEYKILDDDLARPKYVGKNRGSFTQIYVYFDGFYFYFTVTGIYIYITYTATCCIKQLTDEQLH